VAYAGAGQILDTGAKMFHCAPETSSTIVSNRSRRAVAMHLPGQGARGRGREEGEVVRSLRRF